MAKLTRLGKYQLIKRIAVGGMSEIYLASQAGFQGFERAVIVKCIREDLDADPEVREMFLDEARIAACLKHPNIVHLYDVGQERGVAYLTMEYVFGRDLMQISERARALGWELPIPFLVKIFSDVLAGLHYAHEVAEYEDRPLRVIHRDISPQNIMVSFDGIGKVMDFGIAKAEARLSKTQAGILKGKYAYMSPEQVRGKPLDHRSDQFSMAVVFYEILTGTRLFQRDTDYSTMEAVDSCQVPPMKVLRKDVPRRLVRVLKKALRRNPNRRFDSGRDMERALHKLQRGGSVEQAEYVAALLHKLFATEIQARDRALEIAAEDEREIILSSGFEMIGDASTRSAAMPPPPPTAERRYKEIVSQRQSVKTQLRQDRAADPDGLVTDRGAKALGDSESTAHGKPRSGSLWSDWRVLLLVFLAVLVGSLFVFSLLQDQQPTVRAKPPGPGAPKSMKLEVRPGIDGFLSVSVRRSVQVSLDGQDMGYGAFRKHPLEHGNHQIGLKEGGKKLTISVKIEADREEIFAPVDWQ